MNKQNAMKLVGKLAVASVTHAMAANGFRRCKDAPDREARAANALVVALCGEPMTDEETAKTLGW